MHQDYHINCELTSTPEQDQTLVNQSDEFLAPSQAMTFLAD